VSFTRLQFVVGKGGVGKDTVTAALALEALTRSSRVLAVEFGGAGGLARLFSADLLPGRPLQVRPGLHLACFEGEAALAEYLELVVPIRRLLSSVVASPLYRHFVAAAPGLRELMSVGKVWYEYQRCNDLGERLWDVIVVDAGASGHSLQYLQMPHTAASTFGSGLVHRESQRIEALLKDSATTSVHVVATPEEMPLVEARQILDSLGGEMGLPIGEVFVNRCRRLAPEGSDVALRQLQGLGLQRQGLGDEQRVAAVYEGLRLSATRSLGWQRLQESSLAHFEAAVGRTPRRLPLLVSEEFGLGEVESLARLIGRFGEEGQP